MNCLYLYTLLLLYQITEDLAIADNKSFKLVTTGDYVVCELCARLGKSLYNLLKMKQTLSTSHSVFSNEVKHLMDNDDHMKISMEDNKKKEAALQAKMKIDKIKARIKRHNIVSDLDRT